MLSPTEMRRKEYFALFRMLFNDYEDNILTLDGEELDLSTGIVNQDIIKYITNEVIYKHAPNDIEKESSGLKRIQMEVG